MTKKRGHLADLVKGLSSPELDTLLSDGRERHYEPGDHLITEGQPTEYFYDILEGSVALARNSSDGRRQILAFISANHFLGFSSTPGFANLATALTPVTAICYPSATMKKALYATPGFGAEFSLLLTRAMESSHDHIFALGQRSAIERVSAFLLYMRANQARFAVTGPREKSNHIDLPMTRLDIADFLGLTIETVSRAFSSLKKSGAISFVDSRSCEILNIQRIRNLGGREDFTVHRGQT